MADLRWIVGPMRPCRPVVACCAWIVGGLWMTWPKHDSSCHRRHLALALGRREDTTFFGYPSQGFLQDYHHHLIAVVEMDADVKDAAVSVAREVFVVAVTLL